MLTFKSHVTFEQGKSPPVTLRNFWAPENGFIWSQGKWCDMRFDFELGRLPPGSVAELMLDIDAFKVPDRLEGQNALIYLNGLRIDSIYIECRKVSVTDFDPKILRPSDNVLVLDTPDAVVPLNYGFDDNRHLGVQLFSLQIRIGF